MGFDPSRGSDYYKPDPKGGTSFEYAFDNPYGELNPKKQIGRAGKFVKLLGGQTSYDPSGEGGDYFGYDPLHERALSQQGLYGLDAQQQGLLQQQGYTRGLLADAATGQAPSVAQMQAEQQGLLAARNAQGMAAAARGPMAQLARRDAMVTGSNAMADAAGAGAMARANEMSQARGLLSGHDAQTQAAAANMAQQNLAYQGLLSADRQAQLDARTKRQGVRADIAKGNAGPIQKSIGGFFKGFGIGG
jgi:hypothetical protein